MILKFKFKPDYWERAAMKGPNLFIKSLPPKEGYQNFGIGELSNYKIDLSSIITDKALQTLLARKQIIVLEEFVKEEENNELNDTDNQQEGLPNTRDSEVSSTVD